MKRFVYIYISLLMLTTVSQANCQTLPAKKQESPLLRIDLSKEQSSVVIDKQSLQQKVEVKPTPATAQFLSPNVVSDVFNLAAPSTVNITSVTNEYPQGLSKLHQLNQEQKHQHKHFLNVEPNQTSASQYKITGSGIIIRSDGYILASLHVIKSPQEIVVTLYDGHSYKARVAGKDSFTDLALIKISASGLPVARFGNPNQLKSGEFVVAIGNQFGLEHTVTCGLISGLHREAMGFTHSFGARVGAIKYIQTTAAVNPGSSGGPLLNLKGEVIGINNYILEDAQNIGFAIPSDIVKDVGEKLLTQGSIDHPYIGIEMRQSDVLMEVEKRKTNISGVEITSVKNSSPAQLAGLEVGDLILEVDNQVVSTPGEISQAVFKHAIGETLLMKVQHHGENKTFVVRIDKLPESSQ